jgi:putative NADPH-quinone reductase
MSPKSICIVHGHPDSRTPHLCHALGDAYAAGARAGGHRVSEIRVGDLDFGFLRSAEEYAMPPEGDVAEQRVRIREADHLVLVFPLWMGSMPALCRGFLEQCARGGFMVEESGGAEKWPRRMMRGKSARLIVTMGMPAFVYRLFYRAHGVRGLERNLLGIAGFKPVRHTFFGGVEAVDDARRRDWIDQVRRLGERAE